MITLRNFNKFVIAKMDNIEYKYFWIETDLANKKAESEKNQAVYNGIMSLPEDYKFISDQLDKKDTFNNTENK